MQLDWDSLGKLDVIFGLAGGVVLVFSTLRWIARRLKSSRTPKFLAWAIIGDEDEEALVATLIGLAKLTIAAAIWAIIGAIIGVTLVSIVTLIVMGMGSQVSGTTTAVMQNAILGAIVGAIFRAIIWPIFSFARRNWQKRKESYRARHNDFIKQKQRVESKITRTKSND
ncbi:MAG: hypothetical protein HS126_21190 [Anaerolineales bacterium]|nr:hypothetical protein [Anaerolineales bacterium]